MRLFNRNSESEHNKTTLGMVNDGSLVIDLPWTYSRRDFLRLSAVSGAGALLSACSGNGESGDRPTTEPTSTKIAPTPTKETEAAETNPYIIEMLETINLLPDTPYKKFLQNYAVPFYSYPIPEEIIIAGESFEVVDPHVKLIPVEEGRVLSARFTPRGQHVNRESVEAYSPQEEVSFKFPLPYTVGSDNIGMFEQAGQVFETRNGQKVAFASIAYPLGKPAFPMLSPLIELRTYDLDVENENYEFYDNVKKFMYVKEMFGLALTHMYMERAIEILREQNHPIRFPTFNSKGEAEDVELLTQSLTVMMNTLGRFVAALDIAGYGLAIKSVKGSSVSNIIKRLKPWGGEVSRVENLSFGSNPEEIIAESFSWALTDPNINMFPHQGDLNKPI